MKLIELHILQSFPVTCLNRDDVGAPKSALFGGNQRARISSQCWKRAIRVLTKQYNPYIFGGMRTRFIVRTLKELYLKKGKDEKLAALLANITADALGKLDDPEKGNVKTLLFFSPNELESVVDLMLKIDCSSEKEMEKQAKNSIKGLKSKVKDMADIAIFGRMVADDHSLMVEGAGLFSHALSTHAVSNEVDFFSAVDDMNQEGDEGAGHIGSIEFNSACYYRYVGLNVDMLNDAEHLGHFSDEEFATVIQAFCKASILAVPPARKNSQFGHNPPSYILGLNREGQPISLVNAFENPIRSTNGYMEASRKALKEHWDAIKKTYCIEAEQTELPHENLNDFVSRLVKEIDR